MWWWWESLFMDIGAIKLLRDEVAISFNEAKSKMSKEWWEQQAIIL